MKLHSEDKFYSYDEFLRATEDKRGEYIDGQIFMHASPSFEHQNIIGKLFLMFTNFLSDSKCIPVLSPFDLILEKDKEKNVVQPDLMIICEKENLTSSGYKGIPHLIIEVLSPSTASVDYIVKMNLYMRFGVKEYWIVNPKSKTLEVFSLRDDGFYDMPLTYSLKDIAASQIFEGLSIKIEELFK